ncbi:MAG: M28 family peptidase [Candidatus Wallbacteria bacterium]
MNCNSNLNRCVFSEKIFKFCKVITGLFFLFILISCASSGTSAGENTGGAVNGGTVMFNFKFNGGNAYEYVKKQVGFGPRTSKDGKQIICRDYIAEVMRSYGFKVKIQEFTASSGLGAGVKFYNVIADFDPQASGKFKLFGAHYDTLPIAPHDTDETKINTPIDGANDGASGTAVLLELARVLFERQSELKTGIRMIFFDGEDYYTGTDNMFYGSRYYVSQLSADDINKIEYFVLIDMIGDKNLEIYKDINSNQAFPEFNDYVFKTAANLGLTGFHQNEKYAITDDHIPFIQKGIKSVLLIDFDYPVWHTTLDKIDRVSPDSLLQSGKLLEYLCVK